MLVSSTTATASSNQVAVVCPAGRSVLGGGADIDHPYSNGALTANGPHFESGEIVGWRAAAIASDIEPPNWRLDVVVVCPEVTHVPLALAVLAALRVVRARRHCLARA